VSSVVKGLKIRVNPRPSAAKRSLPTKRGARISLSGAVVRTKKDKGYLAEMAFATKAMSLGFNVCKPMGETPGFDFVIESSHAVYKVQVKSGWQEWHGGYPVKISSGTRSYRRDETDFIVIYIVPEDAWYVLPIEAVLNTNCHPDPERSRGGASKLRPVALKLRPAGKAPRMASFFPHVTNSRGRLEIYRDAWHLLGRPSRASLTSQLSGNLPKPGRKPSKRDLVRAMEKKLGKSLHQRRAREAWEALGTWLFADVE